MHSKNYFARLCLRLTPVLLSVGFMLVNLAVHAAHFQAVMPASERWG